MPNSILVYTEAGTDVTKGRIQSSPSKARMFVTIGAVLSRGVSRLYEMLAAALTWVRRKADATFRFMPQDSLQERFVDAAGAMAIISETLSDALVRFVSERAERLADSALGFASDAPSALPDALTYFASVVESNFADALFAFGSTSERNPDALVYFGTQMERSADAKGYFIHISDVYGIQQFLADYIPELLYQREWGAIPVVVSAGASRTVSINPSADFNKAIVIFGRNIQAKVYAYTNAWNLIADINEASAGWAMALLPSNTSKVSILNVGSVRILAFVVWWRT